MSVPTLEAIKTPCVGRCSTVYGDDVCRGCKRFVHEVIDWNSYSNLEKITVIQRLERLMTPIMATKLTVIDTRLLQRELERHSIRYHELQNPYCWSFELLKAQTLRALAPLTDFGIQLLPYWQTQSLSHLVDTISQEFFTLSQSQYAKLHAR